MDPTVNSPGILGAFVTAFLSLIGVVVWILRQQLGQSQKLIDTIPEQIKLFVTQMDKAATQSERLGLNYQEQIAKLHDQFQVAQTSDREFYARQLDTVTRAFVETQKEVTREMGSAIKGLQESASETSKAIESHSESIERHGRVVGDATRAIQSNQKP
jgi:hypothetical protein